MRPKVFDFINTAVAGSGTFYMPVDTHIASPQFAIQFIKTTGAGTITNVSAAFTQWPVLARGTTSATWVKVTGASAGFYVATTDPASCFRLSVHVSGVVNGQFIFSQAGSEQFG